MHLRPSYALAVLMLSLVVAGCISDGDRAGEAVALTPMQRAQMQTKDLPGNIDTAFAATISVLQDMGWQLDAVERDSGVIQASSVRWQDVIGPHQDHLSAEKSVIRTRQKVANYSDKKASAPLWTRWDQLTVFVEPWQEGTVRERITIVKSGTLPAGVHYYPYPKVFGFADKFVNEGGKEQSVVVEDPAVYQRLFQQIRKAIFVRQGLSGN